MNCVILKFGNYDNYKEFKDMLEKENLGFYDSSYKYQLIMDSEDWDLDIEDSFQELVDWVDYIFVPYGIYEN